MSMSVRRRFLEFAGRYAPLLLVAALACGPSTGSSSEGGQDGDGDAAGDGGKLDMGPAVAPQWAFGWWYDAAGNVTDAQGLILPRLEIREDGTVHQEVNYCKTADWTYDARWEATADGRVRILPASEQEKLPFLDYTEVSTYVELRQGDDCSLEVFVGASAPSPVVFARGERCLSGDCLPGEAGCECSAVACGEGTPSCDE